MNARAGKKEFKVQLGAAGWVTATHQESRNQMLHSVWRNRRKGQNILLFAMFQIFCNLRNIKMTPTTTHHGEWGRGKKFERKKVRIAEKVELFSSRTFFLQIFFGSYGSNNGRPLILKLVPNDEE